MSSPKSTALTLLMIGSIFWFVVTCLQMVNFVLFSFRLNVPAIISLVALCLLFVASMLVMIGFIKYRGEKSRTAPRPSMMPPQPMPSTQAAPVRMCPNCGRQIPTEARFCSFCGWQA